MNHTLFRTPLAVAIALTCVVGPQAAVAQEEEESARVEEVVVTARRREESLQDVPIAVTAFSNEKLAMRGIENIGELAQAVPSVTLEPTRATSTTLSAFMRGVGQQDPLVGFEQGVAIYLDDVYLARPQGSLLDVYEVERIEVLRGPQGTLYGRNAVGGAIKYVTRRLGEEPEFRIRASYGSYDQMDLVGTASLPITDGFRVGATIASLTRDGYGENLFTGEDNYDKDLFAYRISAELMPTDNILIRLSHDNTEDESNPVFGFRPFPAAFSGNPVLDDVRDTEAGAAVSETTSSIGGNNEIEAEGWHASIDWTINDSLMVRSITAYREDLTVNVIDFDSLPTPDFDAPVIYDNEQFSQEFQLQFNGENWNAVAGAYYLDATASNDFDVVLGLLGVTAYTGGGGLDTEAWALFADVTYELTDRLSLSLGGRYTEEDRSIDVFRATYLGLSSPFFGGDDAILLAVTSDYDNQKTFDDFSPRINLSYRLNDEVNVYAGFSQGYKAGSWDPRGANFSDPNIQNGYEPETLKSYEAGLKANWFDGQAQVNIAVFYSEYQDMQIPGSTGVDTDGDGVNDDFVGTVTNAGESEIEGIEFEGQFLLTENLTADVAFSLLNADITEWILNGVDISEQQSLQNTPEQMANLALTYTTEAFGGTLNVFGNAAFRGESQQFEFPSPFIDQDSYTLYNASIVWFAPAGNWSVGLHGKNLGDENVKTAGYDFGFLGPSPIGLEDNTTVFYGPPRTFTATVNYNF